MLTSGNGDRSRKCLRAIWCGAFLALSVRVSGQVHRDPIAAARSVIDEFWPEFRTTDQPLMLSHVDSFNIDWSTQRLLERFVLQVGRPNIGPMRIVGADEVEEGIVTATFTFDRTLELDTVHILGSRTRRRELEAIRSEMDHHPEYSDSDIMELIQRHRPRIVTGSKDDFIARLPRPQALVAVFGVVPRLSDVRFDLRVADASGRTTSELYWNATYEVRRGAHRANYYASFEPLDGRLVHLVRGNCPDSC